MNNYIYIYIYKDSCCRSKERIRIYSKRGRSTKRFVFFEFIYFVLTFVLYMCMFTACCFRQRTCVAQGNFDGVLNEIRIHSCVHYKWPLVGQTGLYRGRCSSFLECVYFGLLYPSLIFDIFIVMCAHARLCVCVNVLALEWFGVSLTAFFVCKCVSWEVLWVLNLLVDFSPFFCVCIRMSVCVCVCVCVCVRYPMQLRKEIWRRNRTPP